MQLYKNQDFSPLILVQETSLLRKELDWELVLVQPSSRHRACL